MQIINRSMLLKSIITISNGTWVRYELNNEEWWKSNKILPIYNGDEIDSELMRTHLSKHQCNPSFSFFNFLHLHHY